jgi:MYXO-CTERM domain-containing protein
MNIRVACGLTAAALSSLLGTQAYAEDDLTTEATPISLAGCIQRETEYRQQNNSGKGGFLGFGGGLGDEYVLVNASRGAEGAFGDCTTATGGEAYELTGSAEDDLEPFVGQRVAITGTRKEAEIDVETGRPTGGRQAGDDLRLFEVELASFRPLAPPVQSDIVALTPQEPGGVGSSTVQPPQSADENDRLPRTASPLALTGLLGALSLAGIAALRTRRRHVRASREAPSWF